MIVDLALAGLGALALYRGYRRGFLRGAAVLAAAIAGAFLAFRISGPGGELVRSWTNVSPLAASAAAGIAVFAAALAAGAFLSAWLVKFLGPLRLLDRVAGMAVALVLFLVMSALFLLSATALSVNPTLDRMLADSSAARLVTEQGARVQSWVSGLAGDRVLESLVNLRRLLGTESVVLEGSAVRELPAAAEDDLAADEEAARELFDLANLARVEAGASPLAWSPVLAETASAHGREMYREGFFSHSSPQSGSAAERVAGAGIPFVVVGENLALAPTVAVVHQGLLESPSHRETMLDVRFVRAGVAVWEGPLGLMTVQVFTG